MFQGISESEYQDVRRQIGHYKKMDYHPEIRAAGNVTLGRELEDCFKDYKLQDAIDALKSSLRIPKRNAKYESEYSSRIGTSSSGIYTGVKACLEMKKQTPFQSLITELRDTAMKSYWKKEVGKIPDQTPNLPNGMDPVLTTFGKITKSDETVAELVNPRKTAAEVILDSRIGHKLYKKSHNDYYPSEQVDREYMEPFDRNCKYGKETKIDKRGDRVKRSMRWFDQNVASTVSNLQADFLENIQPRLGRTVVRADMAKLLNGRKFGKVSEHEFHGVGELLKNSLPNIDKSLQIQYLEHINTLRFNLKKRVFPFTDLYQTFVYYDRNKTKTVTIQEIYKILETFKIHPDKKLFEALLNALNLIEDGEVSYKAVTEILSWKYDFPLLPKINDVPLEHQYYSSTYKDMMCSVTSKERSVRYLKCRYHINSCGIYEQRTCKIRFDFGILRRDMKHKN